MTQHLNGQDFDIPAAIVEAPHPAEVDDDQAPSKTDSSNGKAHAAPSASTVLVNIAREMYNFRLSEGGDTFAVPKTGPHVVRMLRGGRTSLRAMLALEYFERYGKAASGQALSDALMIAEGLAGREKEEELHLRVAEHEEDMWVDLGDTTGQAIRIRDGRWAVADQPPVHFRRTALNSPLPQPERGGDLSELWEWLNVTDADKPLLLAWLVAAFFPRIPHPVLSITGEQGTGKTTAEKLLVSLLDPSPVPVRTAPSDKEAWVTAAAGSWVVGLDNLSVIPHWLSDTICRAVTGDGDVRRRLYTDGEHSVFAFRRAVVLNGIDLGAVAGDLADRMIPVELEPIAEDQRLDETTMGDKWTAAHPRLLGALLDLVARVRAEVPSITLAKKPRMADFAIVLAAVDRVCSTHGLTTYVNKQATLAGDSLSADPFISTTAKTILGNGGEFMGTASELLALLDDETDERPHDKRWPTTARQVTQRLKRQAPVMRKTGWAIDNDGGANKEKVVKWAITAPNSSRGGGLAGDNAGKTGVGGSPTATDTRRDDQEKEALAGVAGVKSAPPLVSVPHTDIASCQWWIASNIGQHGPDCMGCRQAPGGPDTY
ncbi:hypothetical protein [Haloglycomyces albus]|uniref:hypothetical protein n=1 Tax=Haloglycomyces albus TaxID=526067 RepID=UPI00046D708E|nr:hypothetical protein [Haloglycomyces albus]